MTRVLIPRDSARWMPGAPSRLLMTTAISAFGILPAATLSASASAQPFQSSKLVIVESQELQRRSGEHRPVSASSWPAGMVSPPGSGRLPLDSCGREAQLR